MLTFILLNYMYMKTTLFFFTLLTGFTACSQTPQHRSSERQVGGSCEGCEAVLEYGTRKLNATDTLPDFLEEGPKLIVRGMIYKKDGKTPAPGVILYIYHTDQKGKYTTRGNEKGWGRRHGYIRGWIMTDDRGRYTFYTLRPASYPGGENPAHIHPVIKEPGMTPYWIDEYLFDDDPILTTRERNSQQKRGGNGIIRLSKDKDGTAVMERDIILGLNIPEYE
jgi:protocatechuate 3,4-dioxygenase, beta subunit